MQGLLLLLLQPVWAELNGSWASNLPVARFIEASSNRTGNTSHTSVNQSLKALPPIREVRAPPQVRHAVLEVPERHAMPPTWRQWRQWQWEELWASLSLMSMLKAFCMAGNILVQLSPYPQVQRWESTGDTGDSDAAPYVSIAFGGWQWCYYGIFAFTVTKRSGFLILVHSNCLGAVLGTYYSWAFYRNCKYDYALAGLQRYSSAVVMLVLFQLRLGHFRHLNGKFKAVRVRSRRRKINKNKKNSNKTNQQLNFE